MLNQYALQFVETAKWLEIKNAMTIILFLMMDVVRLVQLKQDMFVQVYLQFVLTNVEILFMISTKEKFVIMGLVSKKMVAQMIVKPSILAGIAIR
jgi:hypothetical protein